MSLRSAAGPQAPKRHAGTDYYEHLENAVMVDLVEATIIKHAREASVLFSWRAIAGK